MRYAPRVSDSVWDWQCTRWVLVPPYPTQIRGSSCHTNSGAGWPHTGRGCLAPRASRGANASPTPAPRAGSKLASFSSREGPPRSMRMMMVGASLVDVIRPSVPVERIRLRESAGPESPSSPRGRTRRIHPHRLDGRNRAANAAPERFRVPFRPHGWSVDVPAGPGPADRGRGIRPRERLDPVHGGPPRWPCPRHPRPSRGC